MLWPELEQESFDSLVQNFGARAEIYKYGKLPIFQTRAELPVNGDISDGRGAEFTLEQEKFITLLYPDKALEIPNYNNASHFFDFSHSNGHEEVSNFNFLREFI